MICKFKSTNPFQKNKIKNYKYQNNSQIVTNHFQEMINKPNKVIYHKYNIKIFLVYKIIKIETKYLSEKIEKLRNELRKT